MYILALIIFLLSGHVSYAMDKKDKKPLPKIPEKSRLAPATRQKKKDEAALSKRRTYDEKVDKKPEDQPSNPTIHITPATPSQPTNSKRKTERKPSKKLNLPVFPLSPGRKRSNSFDGYSDKPTDTTILIQATLKGNTSRVQKFLKDPDNNPNQQTIKRLDTALHLAVRQFNEEIVTLLITDPRVNSLTKNKDKYAAFQYIIGTERETYKNLYTALLLRANTDQIVNALIMTDKNIIKNSTDAILFMQKLHNTLVRVDYLLPKYAEPQFILTMIYNRLKFNLAAIKKFLDEQEKNPNVTDEWGNTCLHHAIYLRDGALLLSFLKNPKINSLIKNSEDLFVHQLIPANDKYSDLRRLVFARNSLDTWMHKQFSQFSPILLTHSHAHHITNLDAPEFKEIIKKIKDASEEVKNAQKGADTKKSDRALPRETTFPDYADDNFILEAFKFYIQNNKPIINFKDIAADEERVSNEILTQLQARAKELKKTYDESSESCADEEKR